MAFNAGAIVAKLKLDNKGFNTGIKKSVASTKKLTTAAKKNRQAVKKLSLSWKDLGGSFGKFTLSAGAAALAITGLIRAAKRTFELASAGARVRDMEMAFDRLAKRANTSATDVLRSVGTITGALSEKQIITAANTLELLGVGMENTARLTEIARAAGVALGKDTAFMLESIAVGTARQSRLWLDNLGIIISIDEANRDYAKTLGKLSSELTDTEKRAAFLNAVLIKGDDIIAAVSGEAELASERFGTLAADFENLIDTIKKDISEVGGVTFLSGLIKQADIAIEKFTLLGALSGLLVPGFPAVMKAGAGVRGALAAPPKEGLGLPRSEMIGAQIQTRAEAQAIAAKYAAKLAADAKKFFDDLLGEAKKRLPAHTPMGVGTGVRQGRGDAAGMSVGFDPTSPRATIDWTEVADPLADVSAGVAEVSEGMQQATSMATNFFSTLVTGAITAGAGFEKVMMGAIGGVASALGQMIQWGGMGMGALAGINPVAAIVAGAALMGIAGIMRSRGSTATPHIPSYQSVTPRTQEVEQQGAGVTIHVDNFVGDPAWLDGFMRRINQASRANGYAEVFFNAP